MKRKLKFIDKTGTLVTIDVEITDREGDKALDWETLNEAYDMKKLSITGEYANCSGQIEDHIVPATEAQERLYKFWKENHLNSMCAGTKKQTELIKKELKEYDYDKAVKLLKDNDLYIDRGYRYGTKWLYHSFDEEELIGILDTLDKEYSERNDDEEESVNLEDFDFSKKEALEDEKVRKIVDEITDYHSCSDYDACRILALLIEERYGFDDYTHVEIEGELTLSIYNKEYYVGEYDLLEEEAKERLLDDKELWIEAVKNDNTELGLKDWVDEVLRYDGWASVLNSYDGSYNTQKIFGTEYCIARV